MDARYWQRFQFGIIFERKTSAKGELANLSKATKALESAEIKKLAQDNVLIIFSYLMYWSSVFSIWYLRKDSVVYIYKIKPRAPAYARISDFRTAVNTPALKLPDTLTALEQK